MRRWIQSISSYSPVERDIHKLNLKQQLLTKGVSKYYYERIQRFNPTCNAFISVVEEKKLEGVPIAVKDNINVEGIRCTNGSRSMKDHIALYSATVVELLRKMGFFVIGKTNMDEFGMGSTGYNEQFGTCIQTHNFVAGGSSSGSAVAVTEGMVPLALGTDTGGSVRLPASYCGLVGFKPSYGFISRYGVTSYASSLDCVGILARSIQDAEFTYNVISQYDPRDPTSVQSIYRQQYENTFMPSSADKLTIGIPKEYTMTNLSKEMQSAWQMAIDHLISRNINIKEISLPNTKYSLPAYYIIATAEASSNLARFDGTRYGYNYKMDAHDTGADTLERFYSETRTNGLGAEVKRRILLGTFALSAKYYDSYFVQAQKIRRLVKSDFNKAFKLVDFILTPTTPSAAPRLHSNPKSSNPVQEYLADVFTVPTSLAGLPAISVPFGSSANNDMPFGMQLISNYGHDCHLFEIAKLLKI